MIDRRTFLRLTGTGAAVLLFALMLPAQTAKVIPLTAQEAAQRKALEDKRAAIGQEIKDFDKKIQMHYTTVLEGDKDASNDSAEPVTLNGTGFVYSGCGLIITTEPAQVETEQNCQKQLEAERAKNPPPKRRVYRRGWSYGIVYSEDWRFIIPAEAPKYANQNAWNSCIFPASTLTSAAQ